MNSDILIISLSCVAIKIIDCIYKYKSEKKLLEFIDGHITFFRPTVQKILELNLPADTSSDSSSDTSLSRTSSYVSNTENSSVADSFVDSEKGFQENNIYKTFLEVLCGLGYDAAHARVILDKWFNQGYITEYSDDINALTGRFGTRIIQQYNKNYRNPF